MKINEKSWLKNRIAQLIDDLNAVRAAVLNKEKMTTTESASLEPRLFESWVIEKVAQNEATLFRLSHQVEELQQEFEQWQQELKELRKSLPRMIKEARKK